MDFFQALVLGIFQGLGEFLPISSSAHLVLLPYFFGWVEHDLSFDVALHFGTLLAVLIFFWKDWLMIGLWQFGVPDFLKEFFQKNRQDFIFPRNFFWMLVMATLPGAAAGFFLEDYAETIFRQPLLIAGTLFFFGFLLFWVDRKKGQKELGQIGFFLALAVGIFQSLAIVPGVSRSGITIITGLFLGLNRTAAARFSFLLSTPLIFGAAIFKAKDFFAQGISGIELLAVAAATVSGLAAISWMLNYLRKASYGIFFAYRAFLALVVVVFWFLAS